MGSGRRRADGRGGRAARATAPPRPGNALIDTLRWRLLDNPDRTAAVDLGLALRTDAGELAGVLLAFPSRFALGGRRLLGLGSGGFYVEPRARMQGFFMFRRLLKTRGVNFFFTTTCNATSAQLWEKLGGRPVPGANETFCLLLRAGAVAHEYALRGRARGVLAPVARAAGSLATPLLALGRRRAKIAFRAVADWDRMADLVARHRDPDALTCERSAEYLHWRHEQSPAAARNETVLFEDRHGRAGWFVAQVQPDIGQSKIRNYCILDLICPPEGLDPAALLDAMAAQYAGRADLLYLPRTIAERSRLRPPKLWCRRIPFATSYLIDPENRSRPLVETADLAPADGDRFL